MARFGRLRVAAIVAALGLAVAALNLAAAAAWPATDVGVFVQMTAVYLAAVQLVPAAGVAVALWMRDKPYPVHDLHRALRSLLFWTWLLVSFGVLVLGALNAVPLLLELNRRCHSLPGH